MKQFLSFLWLITGFIAFLNISIDAQDDFNKWLNQENNNFQKYLSEEDKKFVEFLKHDWKQYSVISGVKREEKPKPVVTPIFKNVDLPKPKPIQERTEIVPKIELNNEPTKLPKPREYISEEKSEQIINERVDKLSDDNKEIDIELFGALIQLTIPKNSTTPFKGKINKESFAEFWQYMSANKYEQILKQTLAAKSGMNLNDWGYLSYLNAIGNKIYPASKDLKHMLVWFLMLKSGYKIKAGMISEKVYLFIPSGNSIYNVPYFKKKDKNEKIYVIDLDNIYSNSSGVLFTYENDYPGANTILDMNINNSPKLTDEIIEKTLPFIYEGNNYEIKVRLNKGTVDYYSKYPHSNFEIYFDAAESEEIKRSLFDAFKPIIENKSEVDAVNILLRFTQTAFGYKTDDENFQREKPLFVEETLYYPYSDCEDRSILFAFLVRSLLGLEVIAIDFPGHVAAAVMFNEKISGKEIINNGKKYILCDPTYIGATAGMCMPDYIDSKFDIITISNRK